MLNPPPSVTVSLSRSPAPSVLLDALLFSARVAGPSSSHRRPSSSWLSALDLQSPRSLGFPSFSPVSPLSLLHVLPVSHACLWKCAGPSLPSPLTLITSSRVSRLTGCSPCPHPRVQLFTLHPPRMPSWHLKLHMSTAHHLSPKMLHRWRPHPSSGQAPNLASGLDPSFSHSLYSFYGEILVSLPSEHARI